MHERNHYELFGMKWPLLHSTFSTESCGCIHLVVSCFFHWWTFE